MPSDRVPYYLNEQFSSADLNAQQLALERTVEDLLGFSLWAPRLQPIGEPPASGEAPAQGAVIGGLRATTSGGTLTVGPGALLSTGVASPGSPPNHGGVCAAAVGGASILVPAPVSDTWYLVSGRPALIDQAAVSRNVRNGEAWVPTPLVKLRQASLELIVTAGTATDLPATSPATYTPLWGVFRPGGGGAIVSATQVVDVRPFAGPRRPSNNGAVILQNEFSMRTGLTLNARVQLDELDLHACTDTPFDPLLLLDTAAAAPATNQWAYLYLARWRGLSTLCAPRHAQAKIAGLSQQGLLILSTVPPTPSGPHGRRNSAALRPPAPYSAGIVPEGDALALGALLKTASTWQPANCVQDRVYVPVYGGGIPDFTATGDFTFARHPRGARSVHFYITRDDPYGGVTIQSPSGRLFYQSDEQAEHSTVDTGEFPIDPSETTLRLASAGSANWTVTLRSYRL